MKKRRISLVVIWNYIYDARTYEYQIYREYFTHCLQNRGQNFKTHPLKPNFFFSIKTHNLRQFPTAKTHVVHLHCLDAHTCSTLLPRPLLFSDPNRPVGKPKHRTTKEPHAASTKLRPRMV